jgi:hypothetical protein
MCTHSIDTIIFAAVENSVHMYTVGGLEIETCITVSGPSPPEDTALGIFSSDTLVS